MRQDQVQRRQVGGELGDILGIAAAGAKADGGAEQRMV